MTSGYVPKVCRECPYMNVCPPEVRSFYTITLIPDTPDAHESCRAYQMVGEGSDAAEVLGSIEIPEIHMNPKPSEESGLTRHGVKYDFFI